MNFLSSEKYDDIRLSFVVAIVTSRPAGTFEGKRTQSIILLLKTIMGWYISYCTMKINGYMDYYHFKLNYFSPVDICNDLSEKKILWPKICPFSNFSNVFANPKTYHNVI